MKIWQQGMYVEGYPNPGYDDINVNGNYDILIFLEYCLIPHCGDGRKQNLEVEDKDKDNDKILDWRHNERGEGSKGETEEEGYNVFTKKSPVWRIRRSIFFEEGIVGYQI